MTTTVSTKMELDASHPAVAIAMIGAPVVALFLAMYLAWLSLSRRIIRGGAERFASPPAGESVAWEPVGVDEDGGRRPLLELALQREAARRGADFRVGLRGRGLKVNGAWRERSTDVPTDRWHRWVVEACFFRVDEAYGTCETLDVRAKTAFRSSTPPTDWPIVVTPVPAANKAKAPPVPTSELL